MKSTLNLTVPEIEECASAIEGCRAECRAAIATAGSSDQQTQLAEDVARREEYLGVLERKLRDWLKLTTGSSYGLTEEPPWKRVDTPVV